MVQLTYLRLNILCILGGIVFLVGNIFYSIFLTCLAGVIFYFNSADLSSLILERFGLKPSIELKNKVVWITGASGGIGETLSVQWSKTIPNAKLILSARRQEELEQVAKVCQDYGAQTCVLPFDVSDINCHSDVLHRAISAFGRIDVLINNAGISQRALFCKSSFNTVDEPIFRTNLFGPISLTRGVVNHMMEHSIQGLIGFVGSVAKYGAPMQGAYSASKAALQAYFRSVQFEVDSKGIKFVFLTPGPIKSNIGLNALSANGTPCGAAGSVDKLISDRRCVEIILVALANRMDECWIAPSLFLYFAYIMQYLPTLGPTMILKRTFKKRMKLYIDSLSKKT